jgi:hypothetical protein
MNRHLLKEMWSPNLKWNIWDFTSLRFLPVPLVMCINGNPLWWGSLVTIWNKPLQNLLSFSLSSHGLDVLTRWASSKALQGSITTKCVLICQLISLDFKWFHQSDWTWFSEDSLVHWTWITELHSHFVRMNIHKKFIYLVKPWWYVIQLWYTQKCNFCLIFHCMTNIRAKRKEWSVETGVPLSSYLLLSNRHYTSDSNGQLWHLPIFQGYALILLKTMVILCPKNQSFFLFLATTNKPISLGVSSRYFFWVLFLPV